MTTPDTTAHTPLPWVTGKGIAFACSIYSGTTNLAFARQDHGRIDATTAEANAAFIVRACNSHYLLVEALNDLASLICEVAPAYAESTMVANARAALSQAGGASE